jgi:hypothetical protein
MSAISEKTGTLHRVWFPLRSNLTYFEGLGPSLDVEARIKEAALLCEEIAFEFGMLDVTVTENGMWSFWTPPHQLSEETIRGHRDAASAGGPVYLAIGPESTPGVPADPSDMHTMMSGSLQQAFVAEYHLLLRDSGLESASWVKWAVPPPETVEHAKRLGLEQNRREGIGLSSTRLPTLSQNRFLDNQLKKDLNFDLALGGLMGVPAAVDDARRPVLMCKASEAETTTHTRRTPGALALHALAPDYTALSWPDVIALHDDDAIGAFRAKLVELEEAVADRAEDEWEQAIYDLGFEEALRQANDRLPSVRAELADVAVDIATGFLPPGISTAASAARGVARVQRAREERGHEWLAVLFALRRGNVSRH